MSKCEISQVDAVVARGFWEQQDDARIFLHPDVLEPLCTRVDWWLATWSGAPVCLWPVCHAADGSHRSPELSSYVGPLWHDDVARNRAHRWWTITRTVEHAFLDHLVDRYGSFEFELPPGTNDVRVLKWWRDETRDRLEVGIDCRHTAIIRVRPEEFPETLLEGFSRDRHKDLGRTRDDIPSVFSPDDLGQCCALYERLLGGKEMGHIAERRRAELVALIGIAASGFGSVLVYRDDDGLVEGFSLSLSSRRTASMVVIAASDGARSRGLSTRLRMQDLVANQRRGAVAYDFLGANSAVGAEEKHRYGAWPELYFRITVALR